MTAPALSVAIGGAVHGKVKVGEIRSQGELAGEFDADIVVLSGTIKDNTVIRAKSLEVKPTSDEQQDAGDLRRVRATTVSIRAWRFRNSVEELSRCRGMKTATAQSWAREEFGRVGLGDVRRTRRLVAMAAEGGAQPVG